MTSHYSLLPAPPSEGVQPTSNAHSNNDYEHGSTRIQGPDRYEPFSSQPLPYTSPSLTEAYTSHEHSTSASKTPVSSILHLTKKTAVASVTSLTSQHGSGNKEKGSVTKRLPLRTTMLSWMFELFAVAVSIGSLLAIVLILRREDGKPFSAWSLAVTLNTVIATLGTLSRTTLAFALSACIGQQKWNWLRKRSDKLVAWERFDEASRGPWGATRLFIWLRARHWAALGALVIIGTVAFDPFLQAVLSTYGQHDTDLLAQDVAYVQQTFIADAGSLVTMTSGPMSSEETPYGIFQRLGFAFVQPDFGMIGAIYNGFYNDSSWNRGEQNVNNFCATGNCTWPPYASAAVCSSCNDVSDRLVIRKGSNSELENVRSQTNIMRVANFTAYMLPYANISNDEEAVYSDDSDGKIRSGTGATLLVANTTIDPRETMTYQDLETMIMAFTMIRPSKEWMGGDILWNSSRPVATECALYLCANVYRAESQSGKFFETLLQSWALRDSLSYKPDPSPNLYGGQRAADAMAAAQGTKLYDDSIPRTDLRLSMPNDRLDDYSIVEPRTVNVSYTFITAITDFLSELTSTRPDVGQLVYPMWDQGGPPITDALWTSNDYTETFDHVARSLTNQLRNTARNATHIGQVPGTTQQWVIHVRVEWAYLIFPITMVSIGVIYVLLTIVESTRLHIPVWKESALPSLLHGLDNETQSLLRNAQLTDEKVEEVTVRFALDEKEDCLRLRAERGSVS